MANRLIWRYLILEFWIILELLRLKIIGDEQNIFSIYTLMHFKFFENFINDIVFKVSNIPRSFPIPLHSLLPRNSNTLFHDLLLYED